MKSNSRINLLSNNQKRVISVQLNAQNHVHQKISISPTISSRPLAQLFPSSRKTLHSHKNSQIEIDTLARLIQKQKMENPQQGMIQSLSQLQMQQLIHKAKEISQQFKNNHFFSQQPSNSHSRNESVNGPISPSQSNMSQLQKSQTFKNQQIINYNNLKELMSPKKKSFHNNKEQFSSIEQNIGINNGQGINNGYGKNCFNFSYVIGIGGFGKVWRVEHKKTKQNYAMKEMSKALVISKKSVNSVMNERNLLSSLKHPYMIVFIKSFLVNMQQAFQDKENLFLVMDYMQGGDLRYHIGRVRKFTEEQTSLLSLNIEEFFVACVFTGLEHLHNNSIIHRDIKPENLVLDENGYVRLTDLGIARAMRQDNSSDTSGTPGYMAPEVMFKQNHSFSVDFYALGVMAYEFMLGRRPYLGRSRQEIRDQIFSKQVQIKMNEIPNGWSIEGADFINRSIQRKPQNRLGWSGSHELKLHPWLKSFQWTKLMKGELKSPYIPNIHEDNFDQRQIVIEDEENAELIQQNLIILRDSSVQELFNGYEYNGQSQSSSTTDQSSASGSVKHNKPLNTLNKFEKYFEHY